MLARFLEASEQNHNATDVKLRNQQASISNKETQIGQLSKLVQERLLPTNSEP